MSNPPSALPLPIHTKRITSNNHLTTLPNPSPYHPLTLHLSRSPNHSPTLLRPALKWTSIPPGNPLNTLSPPARIIPTATQTTLTVEPPPPHVLCHLSPLMIQHPQRTPGTELLMPTKHQLTEGQHFQTVQLPPPSLHSPIDSLTKIFNSMGNLQSCNLKSLQQQLAHTHTLLNQLNQWLPPAFTSASLRITPKNFRTHHQSICK